MVSFHAKFDREVFEEAFNMDWLLCQPNAVVAEREFKLKEQLQKGTFVSPELIMLLQMASSKVPQTNVLKFSH